MTRTLTLPGRATTASWPSQFWSIPSPGMSSAPGRVRASLSLQSVPPNWDETTVSPSTSGLGATAATIRSDPPLLGQGGAVPHAEPAWMRYVVPRLVGKVIDEVRSVALTSSLQATPALDGEPA